MSSDGEADKRDKQHHDAPGGWPWEVFHAMREGHDRFMKSADDNRNTASDAHSLDNNNPFVAVKSFIDAQFNALSDHFRFLPDNIAELCGQMTQGCEKSHARERSSFERWTHVEHESPDHFAMSIDRCSQVKRDSAVRDALSALSASNQINASVPDETVHALYQDAHTLFDYIPGDSRSILSPATYLQEEGNEEYNNSASEPRWLSVGWFRQSPYSPIQLEAGNPGTHAIDSSWRSAFEDLVDASLGKPLSSPEPARAKQLPSGLHWMLSLHRRGILPPQLPAAHSCWRSASEVQTSLNQMLHPQTNRNLSYDLPYGVDDDLKELVEAHLMAQKLGFSTGKKHVGLDDSANQASSTTESQCHEYQQLLDRGKGLTGEDFSRHNMSFNELFDMVERMEQESQALQLDEEQVFDVSTPKHMTIKEQAQASRDKVDVLSSLTTTQTVRLPDGTVTTKVVLKQRFADGREETQEKVHTYTDPSVTKSQRTENLEDGTMHEAQKNPVSTSWFWK